MWHAVFGIVSQAIQPRSDRLPEDSTFIKKIVFRLIRKHISGSTINSAFRITKELNGRGVATTITFLNDRITDVVKARYNLSSYIQLAKQISRLNLNSGISVRPTQLGFNLPNGLFDKNLAELISGVKPAGLCIWLEYENGVNVSALVKKYAAHRDSYDRLGVELPLRHHEVDRAIASLPKNSNVKLTAHFYRSIGASGGKKQQKDKSDIYANYIGKLIKRGHTVSVLDPDERVLYGLSIPKEYKKNLSFELPLGYNKKWLAKLIKKKVKASVYVPYGKDWIPYATNKLTEGRIREIAVGVLDSERPKVDVHGGKK